LRFYNCIERGSGILKPGDLVYVESVFTRKMYLALVLEVARGYARVQHTKNPEEKDWWHERSLKVVNSGR